MIFFWNFGMVWNLCGISEFLILSAVPPHQAVATELHANFLPVHITSLIHGEVWAPLENPMKYRHTSYHAWNNTMHWLDVVAVDKQLFFFCIHIACVFFFSNSTVSPFSWSIHAGPRVFIFWAFWIWWACPLTPYDPHNSLMSAKFVFHGELSFIDIEEHSLLETLWFYSSLMHALAYAPSQYACCAIPLLPYTDWHRQTVRAIIRFLWWKPCLFQLLWE